MRRGPMVLPLTSSADIARPASRARAARTPWAVSALTVLLAIVLAAPSVLAGSSQDPEVSDGVQDVDPGGLIGYFAHVSEAEAAERHAPALDIERAYIYDLGPEHLGVTIEVVDLDGSFSGPAELPTEQPSAPEAPSAPEEVQNATGEASRNARPELVAAYEAWFVIGDQRYVATATSTAAAPDPEQAAQGAFPGFQTSYTLDAVTGSTRTPLGAITGVADLSQDAITMKVPRSLVGSPADGAVLSQFFAASLAHGLPMDYAPDSEQPIDEEKLLSEQTLAAKPSYGRDFVIGSTLPGWASAFTVELKGADSATVGTNSPALFTFQVRNDAKTNDEIQFTHRDMGSGWAVDIEPSRITLTPGATRVVTVTVTPAADAAALGRLIVEAQSLNGDDQEDLLLTVYHSEASTSGGAAGDAGADGADSADGITDADGDGAPDQSLGEGDAASEDTPGPSFLVAAGGLLGMVAYARRRR